MKKHILFFYCFFSFSTAYSQFSLGVKSGVNISKQKYFFDDDFSFTSASISGLEIGILASHYFTNKIGIQAEINFLQKGGKIPNDYSIKIDGIDFSTSINFRITSDKLFSYIGGGGYLGYNIKGISKDILTQIEDSLDFESAIFKRHEAGILCVNGIGININKNTIFLEVKYRHSLTFFQKSELNEGFQISTKNIGLSFQMGYLLKF